MIMNDKQKNIIDKLNKDNKSLNQDINPWWNILKE